jgi:two-component system chemotaxis response regulator CheY
VPYNILVVDDSKAMRMMVLRSLRAAGFDVASAREAANGREAQERLKEGQLDVIFSDWNMPEMNGIDFLRWVRAESEQKEVPFFLITTESGQEQVAEAAAAGVTGYLEKPFTNEDLEKKLIGFL